MLEKNTEYKKQNTLFHVSLMTPPRGGKEKNRTNRKIISSTSLWKCNEESKKNTPPASPPPKIPSVSPGGQPTRASSTLPSYPQIPCLYSRSTQEGPSSELHLELQRCLVTKVLRHLCNSRCTFGSTLDAPLKTTWTRKLPRRNFVN